MNVIVFEGGPCSEQIESVLLLLLLLLLSFSILLGKETLVTDGAAQLVLLLCCAHPKTLSDVCGSEGGKILLPPLSVCVWGSAERERG